ncbi:MAG: glucokinase, partial [Methylococcaceae bacterium]|nr:glucokinase [Methylococcaceae bacterium]
MILAGDIGGTKTVLSILNKDSNGSLMCLQEQTYSSQQFPEFEDILTAFLPADVNIKSACFGVAG